MPFSSSACSCKGRPAGAWNITDPSGLTGTVPRIFFATSCRTRLGWALFLLQAGWLIISLIRNALIIPRLMMPFGSFRVR